MRKGAVAEFLKCAGTGWDSVHDLIKSLNLVVLELEYQGKKFYVRRLPTLSLPTFD